MSEKTCYQRMIGKKAPLRSNYKTACGIYSEKEVFNIPWDYCPYCGGKIIEYKPEPKLVPFDFTDAGNLIGEVVKNKNSNMICMITGLSNSMICLHCSWIPYYTFLEDFTFLDDSTCGKVVQE